MKILFFASQRPSYVFLDSLCIQEKCVLSASGSDFRIWKRKTNIMSLDSTLSKVMQLNPVSFNWLGNETGNTDIGFIAQEINGIFPEVTFINPTDGKMGINYSRLPSILTKAIQEQQIIIQENYCFCIV